MRNMDAGGGLRDTYALDSSLAAYRSTLAIMNEVMSVLKQGRGHFSGADLARIDKQYDTLMRLLTTARTYIKDFHS